jgi:hypothetical protein
MSENIDTAERPEETKEVKSGTLLLQHLQRDANTRSLRSQRSGHRRQGVLLDDGTRIRQRGYRVTEISTQTLADNHQSILEHVREGRVAIFTPDEKELSYEQLVALLKDQVPVVLEASLKEAVHDMLAVVRDDEIKPSLVKEQEVTLTPMVDEVTPAMVEKTPVVEPTVEVPVVAEVAPVIETNTRPDVEVPAPVTPVAPTVKKQPRRSK